MALSLLPYIPEQKQVLLQLHENFRILQNVRVE